MLFGHDDADDRGGSARHKCSGSGEAAQACMRSVPGPGGVLFIAVSHVRFLSVLAHSKGVRLAAG